MIINQNLFFRLFGSGEAEGLDGLEFATRADRRVLLALARTIRPGVVVEIGVQTGITASVLLRECPWIEQYIGIDLPIGEMPVLDRQAKELPDAPGELVLDEPRFELIQSDSMLLAPESLPIADLVYIDGGHDREHVEADTRLARAILRPGGVCVWHDYVSEKGVRETIDALNQAEGDHIALVDASWTCFELWRGRA